ncbi:hypothetical protein [Chamaesiphon polymorphus]|uniref:Uncharacterized protein n=1 Tax=Chamaesiphon polymorphus CCALA 037 TaxID=2107692 RepID=A0A2T1GJ66_9CYAN|nr:hypothetical protein [Chamaesiphon polymorphus]PSB57833.1 hypothetical protein C7B77_07060 [Chamaesiphon polymorphus CCALA 037]
MNTIAIPKSNYTSILKDAAKIAWQVPDLIGNDKPLDFSKPFLPEALAHTRSIACLTPDEQLTLNHIRANKLSRSLKPSLFPNQIQLFFTY